MIIIKDKKDSIAKIKQMGLNHFAQDVFEVDDEDDDVVESSSSKSSDESKTKMFKLMIIITCVTAGLLLVLYIASFFTNKAYTY